MGNLTDEERIARAAAKRERRAARQLAALSYPSFEEELSTEAALLTDRHERAWHVIGNLELDSFRYDNREVWDHWVFELLIWAGHDPYEYG